MIRLHLKSVLLPMTMLVLTLSSQTPPKRTAEQLKASYDAHQGDFDYLLGDWEFTSVSKEYGPGKGRWSAVRLAMGQIMDEFRVTGDNGETYYVSTTVRAYNAALDRWELVSMTNGDGLQDVGTGHRAGSEVHIEQKFDVMGQTPTVLRIVYSDIRPDRFSWKADRSTDGGKTWSLDHQRIEARRIGPARSLDSLTPPRKAAAR